MPITKLDKGAASHFLKNGLVTVFDEVSDYSAATMETITNPVDVGDILEGSTSWDGEEISFEDIKNEKGEGVVSTVTNGTYAYSFSLMSTDKETLKKFLKGVDLTLSAKPTWMSDATGVGFGVEVASYEAPIAWWNQDINKILFFPKARIVAGLAYDDSGLMVVNVKVSAQKVDTENLKTVMMLNGKLTVE